MYAQQHHVNSLFNIGRIAPVLSLLVCLSLMPSTKTYAETVIGKATLVIGKAYIQSQGKKQRLNTGDAIYENRQIMTSANGHVHIRFNDQGLISVRPNSRLSIDRYDYNTENPSLSTVKFNLIRGATRSVSGQAAKSAKQRFRMNTPIAAIGVRGTDFVVRADQNNIQANVNEGAIIVAPFSDQCTVDALGPCAANAVVLSGESNQLLKFNQLLVMPQLLPSTDKKISHQLLLAAASDTSTTEETSENVTDSDEVTTSEEELLAFNEYSTGENRETNFVFNENSANNTLTNPVNSVEKKLVWGRWGNALSTDTIAISSAAASDGRRATVGNASFGLFRSGGYAPLVADLGVVSFNLASAQASYTQGGKTSAMQVAGGALNIDFNNKSFGTQLNLQHANTGKINFYAIGNINASGFFISRSEAQKLAGAVSLDGQEAGYSFDKEIGTGTIEGITLWGAQ